MEDPLQTNKESHKTLSLPIHIRKYSFPLTGLFILACFYTLAVAHAILLPIVIAFLLYFLFVPFMHFLKKMFIPRHVAAIFIILFLIFIVPVGFYSLSGAIGGWLTRSPQILLDANAKLAKLVTPWSASINRFIKLKEQVEKSTTVTEGKYIPEVRVNQSQFFSNIFNNTRYFFTQLIIILILLYFLLVSEDFFLRKLIEVIPHLAEKKDMVNIAHEINHKISVFLMVKIIASMMSAGAISLMLVVFHMPHPFLWGVTAGLLQFIPYVGILIGTIAIGLASILTFDTVSHIILIPTIFFLIASFVGNFIEPVLLSRNLTLNPIVTFIAIIFWGWLWGIPGALIAVPLISIFKIICDNLEPLTPVGKFLGE